MRLLRILAVLAPGHGRHISIWAGSLHAPTGLKASKHIFVAEKGDYYEIADSLPQWPGKPPPDG
ncbi:MAG TPA: hypothetical protein VGG63_08990 [Steroidobacteraceae bacterium]